MRPRIFFGQSFFERLKPLPQHTHEINRSLTGSRKQKALRAKPRLHESDRIDPGHHGEVVTSREDFLFLAAQGSGKGRQEW